MTQGVAKSLTRSGLKHRKKLLGNSNDTIAIEDFICGEIVESDEFLDQDYVGLVKRLRVDISELTRHISASLCDDENVLSSAVTPFLMRKFIELSLISLLSRIDPVRVIAARKNQLDGSYVEGKQNASSVSWVGDIFPRAKMVPNPWGSDALNKGIERSLFGSHVAETAIRPSLQWLVDRDNASSEWLRELSAQDDPLAWLNNRLSQLYSLLSKGVHAEYLLDEQAKFDATSIRLHVGDGFKLVLLLAAATHRSPLFLRSLPIATVLKGIRQHERQVLQMTR